MKFAIYEEFPTDENLGKLTHIDFPVDIIVASKNLTQFQDLERQIKSTNSNVQRVGYWPVLTLEEGYWMSPFSDRKALERVISELEERSQEDDRLLLKWDAELPAAVRPRSLLIKLIAKESLHFLQNRKKIQEFLKNHNEYNIDLFTAEWPIISKKILEPLGVAFDPYEYDSELCQIIYCTFKKYVYEQIGPPRADRIMERILNNELKKGVKNYGERFAFGVGCLDCGIFGNEPIMNLEEFKHNLDLAKEYKVNKAVIYRLGGITPDHVEIMKQYLK